MRAKWVKIAVTALCAALAGLAPAPILAARLAAATAPAPIRTRSGSGNPAAGRMRL
jgi:hypothetical protein